MRAARQSWLAFRLVAALGLVAGAVQVPAGPAVPTVRALGPEGVGAVHFGTSKAKAVLGLDALLGSPAWRGPNTGCGPRYSEVGWGQLVAEFRLGIFSGYRYIEGGWPLTTPGSPHRSGPSQLNRPRLATARGISLGSTLLQLRVAYGALRFVGVDKWQAANGLVFVVDAAQEPEPPASRVVEVKFGTCGDF